MKDIIKVHHNVYRTPLGLWYWDNLKVYYRPKTWKHYKFKTVRLPSGY